MSTPRTDAAPVPGPSDLPAAPPVAPSPAPPGGSPGSSPDSSSSSSPGRPSRRPSRGLWLDRERTRRRVGAAATLVALVGVLSAASPPAHRRLGLLLEVLPFAVPRTSAAVLVFASVTLLVAVRGLRRGQRLAWAVALALLLLSAVLHLLKGVDVEESVIALVVAAWLVVRRSAFPVRPSAAAVRRAAWLAGTGTVVGVLTAAGLAVEGARHHPRLAGESSVDYAARAAERGTLPLPFVGPAVGPVVAALVLSLAVAALWVLLEPRRAVRLQGADHLVERERARAVVRRWGSDTLAEFALRDDKDWFFTGRSVVAHAVRGGVCLVSPDPVGPAEERVEVWAEFMAYAEDHGWSVTVVGAAPSWLPVYEASGLRSLYLGDEAIVDTAAFTLEGRSAKQLRSAQRRVERAGVVITQHDPAALEPALVERLEAMSGDSRRGGVERGFSMTLSRLFDPADTGLLLTVARDAAWVPVGFVQWVPAPELGGWSLDVMRRSTAPGVPNGVIEALVLATIEHQRARGGGSLGLNFAVLRDVVEVAPDDVLGRLRQRAVTAATSGTQVATLARFNERFGPTWRPRYVVVDSAGHVAAQGLAIAEVEGLTDVPVLGPVLARRR